ncbi:MAG: hypothetical protein ACLFP4_03560 [Spirochaetales bacterium]
MAEFDTLPLWIESLCLEWGMSEDITGILARLAIIVIILVMSLLANFIPKRVIITVAHGIASRTTFLIRHLRPRPTGLPIEIYVFSADQVWANFEGIQADIFDHLLAVLPEFELGIFQKPSGLDVQAQADSIRGSDRAETAPYHVGGAP